MSERDLSEFPNDFIDTLRLSSQSPTPDPTFVSALERQLLQRQAGLHRAGRNRRKLIPNVYAVFPRLDWRYALVATIMALAVALMAIGPQRVLAQVQRWLSYVPGIGFVNLEKTRVLVSPAELTREGTTVQVEQVVAGPTHTQIVFSSPGLSENNLPWPNPAVEKPNFSAFLLLPDGSQLEATRWELTIGAGKLEFPALPANIHQVRLLLPRLPLVPPGTLPENWEITLNLRPATGELIDSLFPAPYSPAEAIDSHHGVTLRVLDVAQTSTETAVHYEITWDHPDWEFRLGLSPERLPEMRDNLGQIYTEKPASNGSSVAVVAIPTPGTSATPTPTNLYHEGTLVFPSLSLMAGRASLWLASLEFEVPAQGGFSLDLGKHPQIGDSWPLDVRLDVAGFPVHLTGAHMQEEMVMMGDGSNQQRTFLALDLEPGEEQDGLRLAGFDLADPQQNMYGMVYRRIHNGMGVMRGRVDFADGVIPTGQVELQVTGATVLASGPWEASWSIPGKGAANAAPAQLYPETSPQPSGMLRPVIKESFLSDRLTALKIGAAGLPQGVSFLQALPYDPATYDFRHTGAGLYLEDDWGRRYEAGRNEVFLRLQGDEIGYQPGWLYFPPLEPLAQKLRLNIPGVELLVPGEATFEIEVPSDLKFYEKERQVTVIGGGGPQRQVAQTYWASDPWVIDIALEVAGYRLHFDQAQVERDERSDPPYTLYLTSGQFKREQNGLYLNHLRFSEEQRPDGQMQQIDPKSTNSGLVAYPAGGVYPLEPGSKKLQLLIGIDITAANGIDLLPGRYRLALSGVTVWAPGPWELTLGLQR